MTKINFKTEISGTVDEAVERVTEALKKEGFGVLTRIDLHKKIKEKIGKDIAPVVILGACNPNLAYEAYLENPDVTSLLPCNAVVREISEGRISVELAKPSALMEVLGDSNIKSSAVHADRLLEGALRSLNPGYQH